jgi:hypothetical protein
VRSLLVVLVVLVATATVLAATPAEAETWTAPDQRRDVRASPYRPNADPCDQPSYRRLRNDKLHDILQLGVDHGTDAVVLTLVMRDVTSRDASTSYNLHLRTPGHAFSLDLVRFEPGGDLQSFFSEEPDHPSPAEVGDDCTYVTASTGLPCEGLDALADDKADQLTVTLPRACLGDPSWVKAAAEVYGFSRTDAQGRFTTFSDVRAPHGVRRSGFLPPFGPRVRQG